MDSSGKPFTKGMLAASTTTQQPSASVPPVDPSVPVDNMEMSNTVTQPSTTAHETVELTVLHNDEIKKLKKLISDLNAANNKDLANQIAACDKRIVFIKKLLAIFRAERAVYAKGLTAMDEQIQNMFQVHTEEKEKKERARGARRWLVSARQKKNRTTVKPRLASSKSQQN